MNYKIVPINGVFKVQRADGKFWKYQFKTEQSAKNYIQGVRNFRGVRKKKTVVIEDDKLLWAQQILKG